MIMPGYGIAGGPVREELLPHSEEEVRVLRVRDVTTESCILPLASCTWSFASCPLHFVSCFFDSCLWSLAPLPQLSQAIRVLLLYPAARRLDSEEEEEVRVLRVRGVATERKTGSWTERISMGSLEHSILLGVLRGTIYCEFK